MNPIEAAVAPLKQQAIERAEQEARKTIAHVASELTKAGNDLRAVAPYPTASYADYFVRLAKYKLYRSLTTWREGQIVGMHGPEFGNMDAEKEQAFIAAARQDAAEQYDAFVAKLNQKIGPAKAARLEGNHVWSYSHLFVTTAAGTEEIWKTQMIVNVSKLGKLFNQFPTRKVKEVK